MSFPESHPTSPISSTSSTLGSKHRPDYRYTEKEKPGCCCGRKYRNIFPKDDRLVATKPIFKGDG